MSQVEKGAGKRLLSWILTVCMVFAMIPVFTLPAAAASLGMSSPNLSVSAYDTNGNQWGMWQNGDTENGKYQFSSNSYWRGMIGDAVPKSGMPNTSQDPQDYKAPALTWAALNASTTSWSYVNVDAVQNLSNVIIGPQMTMDDKINNTTGETVPDGQTDTIYISGEYGYAGSGLKVTAKIYLGKNSVTGAMDVVTYAWEVKNIGTTAKVFGLSWNVDTMIGGSNGGGSSSTTSGDSAPFMAPGTNMWTVANHSGHDLPGITVTFPTPSTSNALGLKTRPGSGTADYYLYPDNVNIYESSLPSYVYALNPLKKLPGADGTPNAKHFTAMMFPYILNDSEWGSSFVKADFMGFGYYSSITGNYGWNSNGSSASSLDSGHIVRWDPRVIVPGETVYMGIRYGQGDAELAVAGELNFLLDNVITEMPVVNNQYDSASNPFEVIAKVQNDMQNFSDAYVKLTVEKAYLDVDPSVAGAGQWVFDSEDTTNKYYTLQLGALDRTNIQFQLNPVLKLVATPVYTDVDPSDGYDGAIAHYSLELVADEGLPSKTTISHDNRTIELPRLSSMSVVASVFLDVNGNHIFDGTFEAISGVNFELKNMTTPSTPITAVTRNDGTFNALTGLTSGDMYTFTMTLPGSMATDYVIAGVTNNSIGTGSMGHFDISRLGDGVVEFTVPAPITEEIKIDLEIELARAAMLEIYPHTGAATPPASSTYVLGGIADVAYTIFGSTFNRSSGLMSAVPYGLTFAANSNATVTFTAPQGYRMASNHGITESRIKNNLAPYSTHGAYQEYFQLTAGDLRLKGVTATSGSPTQAANPVSVNTATAEVTVDTTWVGVNTQLDFSVWDSTVTETYNPTPRTNYSWTLVSDPSGIIQTGSFSETSGTFTFTGAVGIAKVKVTTKTAPYLSHEMVIEVGSGATATYNSIHIAKASDATLASVTDLALIANDTTELVVVGVDASGNKTKLMNNAATLVSSSVSIATVTAVPSATSMYNFTLKGIDQGCTTITAGYAGGLTADARVLVTLTSLSGAAIAITPNPVNLTSSGGPVQVTYKLNLADGSTMTLHPAFVTPVVADTGKAALESGTNDTLVYVADGTTTLTAKLNVQPSVTGSAAVKCSTGGAPVTPQGILTLQEDTAISNTGGFIKQASTAQYFAFFDTDGDGVYTAGTDILLPHGTANTVFSSIGNHFTTGAGTVPNVLLTGSTSTTGVDRLTVTYTHNGIPYTASADIVVYSNGYSYDRLEVTPGVTVLHVGDAQTYAVKAVFSNASGAEESYTLPTSMYTGSVPSGGSYASLVTGSQNQVKGDAATGEAIYRAKLVSDPSKSGDAKILVIPAGAYLSATPDPLWIKINNSESVAYQLYDNGGTPISVANLKDYVSASIGSHTVAQFNTISGSTDADIESVRGDTVGRTTLTAYLHGQTAAQTVTVYVWDDSNSSATGIRWVPNQLQINTGSTGNSTVHLINSDGSQGAAVNLEHLTGLAAANTAIATIPTSPAGTALTVTGAPVTVTSNTTVTAISPAGSAVLDVEVRTGTTVSGLTAAPAIIELWPGETKTVTIRNTGTGVSLDAAQLAVATKTVNDISGAVTTENDISVDTTNAVLEISQAGSGVAVGSVNTLTITLGGQNATVYIVNYTQNPYLPGSTQSLELVINPDPTWVEKDLTADTAAILELTDASGTLVDSIALPAAVVSWMANTSGTSLPGRISLAASTASNQTIVITGLTAGAQTYSVTYSGGSTPLTANGSVFVFAQDPTLIQTFEFEPEIAVLTPGATQNIRGVITYNDNTIQYVTPQELPITVPDLASADTTTAVVSVNGIIRGQSLGTDSARDTYVDGTLIGTTLTGRTDVLVYDPSATMSIDPDSFLIYMSGGSPNIQNIVTKLNSYVVPNIFLTYAASNSNVSLAAGGAADYDVTGVSEGMSTITSLLKTTTKSATAIAEVRDPSVTYYTVDYDAGSGSGSMASFTAVAGSTHTVQPNGFLAPSGEYFIGWNTAANGSGAAYGVGDPLTVTGDVTLYAQWDVIPPLSYTVTYEGNGGSGSMTPDAGVPGTSYTVQANGFTAPIGMQFKEWNTVANGSGTSYAPNSTFTLNSDVTLYALWENVYTVTYNANGGSGTMPSDTDVQGTTYTVRANGFMAPAGMQFKEWNTANNGSGTSYASNSTFTLNANVTLYAIWETLSTGTTYTVIYDANGEDSGTAPVDGNSYAPGGSVTILGNTGSLTKFGHTFMGWALNSAGSGVVYTSGDAYTIHADTTFYAVWDDNSNPVTYYKLTVQAGTGGTVNTAVNGLYQAGSVVTISASPNTNYSFNGWTSSVNGVPANVSNSNTTLTMPASNVTVTANFTYSGGGGGGGGGTSTYTVTYTANGGTGSDYKVSSISSGSSHTVLPHDTTGIARDRYVFIGWNIKADGSGTAYSAGDKITMTANITLYAQWKSVDNLLDTATHHAYLNGYLDGSVKPDNAITRAEVAAIFYRLLKNPGTTQSNPFSDVKGDAWYAQAVNFLASLDILAGYPDGNFRPNAPITREEFAAVASRFDSLDSSVSNVFSDVRADSWAVSYINSAYAKGWINGYPDGTFKPSSNIARAEVVSIINAMLGRKIDNDALAQVDNPFHDLKKSHWAYSDIIEAAVAHEYERDQNSVEIWQAW